MSNLARGATAARRPNSALAIGAPTGTMRVDEIAEAIDRGRTIRIPRSHLHVLLEAARDLKGRHVWDIQIEGNVATLRKADG